MRNPRDRSFRLVALGAAGAIGVAAVYFLDPVLGARRRRLAKAWISATVRQVFSVVPAASSTEPTTSHDDLDEQAPVLELQDPWERPAPIVALPIHTQLTDLTPQRAAVVEETPERIEPLPQVAPASRPRPRPRRLSVASLTGLAVVAALGAVALGSWALLRDDGTSQAEASRQATQQVSQAITLLADPQARRIPVQNSNGKMVFVVGADGRAVLILDRLSPAPDGKTYQAWVIPPNADAPIPAGVFDGGEMAVPLGINVPMGATVAVTVETAGGALTPTEQPKLVAKRG